MNRVGELIDAALAAVDDHMNERAQALAQIAQAAALASISGSLANIAAALHSDGGGNVADSLARIAEHADHEAALRAVGTTIRDEFYG